MLTSSLVIANVGIISRIRSSWTFVAQLSKSSVKPLMEKSMCLLALAVPFARSGSHVKMPLMVGDAPFWTLIIRVPVPMFDSDKLAKVAFWVQAPLWALMCLILELERVLVVVTLCN